MYILYLRLNMVFIAGVFQHFLEFEEDCVPKRELALAVALLLRQKECRKKYCHRKGRKPFKYYLTFFARGFTSTPPLWATNGTQRSKKGLGY